MWTYLKRDSEGEWLAGEKEKFPTGRVAFLAFDACRWCVVLAYSERGGGGYILDPNVDDDCCLVAFAPLSETSDPDPAEILRATAWLAPDHQKAQYATPYSVKLLRN